MVEELIDVNRKTDTGGFVANQGCFLFYLNLSSKMTSFLKDNFYNRHPLMTICSFKG